MKYLIILLASLVPTIAFSQAPFQKTYGGTGLDFSYTLDYISADSSYIIGGKTNSAGLGFYDAVLAKTDQAGTIQWIKIIGGIGDDLISSVIQTSNNGFIGAGLTTSFGSGGSDVYIVRTDANGDTLWTRAYGNTMDDWANKIIQTSDGGFLVAGVSEINPGFVYGAYFIKLDAQGDTIWSKIYHSFSYEYANAVIQTSDGGYVFAGNSRGVSNGGFDFFLIKTDALGNVLWNKIIGGSANEFAYAIKETSNGGFIVVGSTKSYGAGDTDIFLVKTDSTGTIDWSKTYGGVAEDYANDLIIDAEGNYVISGTTKSFGGGGSDCYLLKVKNNGDLLWANTYGGVDDEVNWGLTQTTNGWYTFVGQTKSYGSGGIDMFLVRTDLDGLNNSSCDNSDSATTVSSPTTNSMGGYWLTSGVTTTDSSMVMTNSSLSPSIVCFGCDSLLPGYTFHRTSFQVIFIDLSSGGFVVKWDFGDGDTSSLQNPTHTYATSGTYKVCLTIGNSCGIDSFCGNITVGTGLSILELGSSGSIIKVDIAPNPFEHYAKFSVQLDQKSIQETSFALYDVLGNQVMSKDRLSANNFFVYKDVLPSGIYFYLFTHQQRIIGTGKLIIQ